MQCDMCCVIVTMVYPQLRHRSHVVITHIIAVSFVLSVSPCFLPIHQSTIVYRDGVGISYTHCTNIPPTNSMGNLFSQSLREICENLFCELTKGLKQSTTS